MMAGTVRSISQSAWAAATEKNPTESGAIGEAVDACMAELLPQDQNRSKGGYSPWLNSGGQCYGAMWPSVPRFVDHWRNPEGDWIFSINTVRPQLSKYYLRLSPAPKDAEVQYGFCPIRLDRTEEVMLKHFGPGTGPFVLKAMPISSGSGSQFRVDKMAIALAKLSSPRCRGEPGKKFRRLLAKTGLGSFTEDMLRGVYGDSSGRRNILWERDPRYAEMVQLVAEKAYPGFLRPSFTNKDMVDRFKTAMDLEGNPDWDPRLLAPIIYSVVMPAPIFEAVDKNMELGIPPIIPQYVTPAGWMFNGRWSEPCTGVTLSRANVASVSGLKIVAGLINKLNCDLPGKVNYWPLDRKPPREWVDSFVGQVRELGKQSQPMPSSAKADLALLYARNIPVVIDISHGEELRVLRYSKLVDVRMNDSGRLTGVTTRECDSRGEWIGPPNPSEAPLGGAEITEDDPVVDGQATCVSCRNEVPAGDGYTCDECGEVVCDNCSLACDRCEGVFCASDADRHGDCRRCVNCGVMIARTDAHRCSCGCNAVYCDRCHGR